MSFPGSDLDDLDLGELSRTVTVVPRPATLTTTIARVVAGGGEPVPGVPVTYTVTPSTSTVRDDVVMQPQYVFVAPHQWEITSASFPPGVGNGLPSGPLTVTQVTIDGQVRDAIVVQGDAGWGANQVWPSLQVVATPTTAAPAGSMGRADFFQGDALENFTADNAVWSFVRSPDAADIDGDGSTTESFARTWVDTRVGASAGITVVKEICRPDGGGGCTWESDPSTPVEVAPTADDIQYRVTIVNGATAVSDVVLYDVLPHPGDVNLISGAPRGSTFAETVASVGSASPGLTLSYSGSTNPCRPEIDASGPTGCDPDWSAPVGGARSIRAEAASLAAGASVSFTYAAAIEGEPADGDLGCNSVIVTSASTTPIEPAAVCAVVGATDTTLEYSTDGGQTWSSDVTAPAGATVLVRHGFANLGTAAETSASIATQIPDGFEIDPGSTEVCLGTDLGSAACVAAQETAVWSDGDLQVSPGAGHGAESNASVAGALATGSGWVVYSMTLPDAPGPAACAADPAATSQTFAQDGSLTSSPSGVKVAAGTVTVDWSAIEELCPIDPIPLAHPVVIGGGLLAVAAYLTLRRREAMTV
jgi:hypothetical protein